MKDGQKTGEVIDILLRFAVGGGLLATLIVAPNAVQIFKGPLKKYFDQLDKKEREKELRRIFYYMKQQGLVVPTSEDYAHGLVVTKKGKERLHQREFDNLRIVSPKKWDHKWRIVFFDIPESKRAGRRSLIYKLKQLNFVQLQRSVWVHPFPCRSEIELVAGRYEIQKYLSYVEATGIDSEDILVKQFSTLIK